MSRAPFLVYLALILSFVIIFVVSNAVLPWIAAGLLTLFLPIPLSMRLRDAGLNPWLAAPLLIGLIILAFGALVVISSVSGTPGVGPSSRFQSATTFAAYIMSAMTAIFVLYGAFARSNPSVIPNEVPS